MRLLTIFFGKEYFHHIIIIFTFCDDNQRESEETQRIIDQFESNFHIKPETFYTSKNSKDEIKNLGEKVKGMRRFDCELFQELRKIENDPNKTRLDLDNLIEDKLGDSLVQNRDCLIL